MNDNDSKMIEVGVKTEGAVAVEIIDEEALRGKIYVIRGQKVMLDFELAEIYGYSTKAFNQQVKNNIEKFDDDFMFQLSDEETAVCSRSKNLTLNKTGRGSNFKYNPYAFTEQGVYMLMTVLRGDLATRQSKALIRLFKQLKDYALEGRGLVGRDELLGLSARIDGNAERIDALDRKVDGIINGMSDAVRNSAVSDVAEGFGTNHGRLIACGEPVEGQLANPPLELG